MHNKKKQKHVLFTKLKVTTSPSSEAIVTVSQQVMSAQENDDQNKQTETGVAISDLSSGNLNSNPLLVSSSLSHSNHLKANEIKKKPAIALGPAHQSSEIGKSIENQKQSSSDATNPSYKSKARKETLETKRERKAAKTLAIITGAFVMCWLPFFLMALVLPLCGDTCSLPDKIASLFLWLGYFNSTLNPVIYTIFSPEFRQAFKRILFGSHRTGYYRGGKL